MGNPKFSIVIPTRERHETLKCAIDTCLNQDFTDYEIVISDNCSSPATKQVVEAFASPLIQYSRSDQPLSMLDNWNRAYGLSRGDFVTFIGDDDGLLPFGLRQLDLAIKRHNVKAIRWDYAVYAWPSIIAPEFANYLQLSLLREERILDSRATIKAVLQGRMAANQLPNIYHSAVARNILEEIRSRSGSVFIGFHPDTYTSFGVAYFSKQHLSTTIPVTVSGFSGSSYNMAFSFLRRKHRIANEQYAENSAYGISLDPRVPDLPTLWSVLADSFLHAKRTLFPADPDLVLDRKLFAKRVLTEMPIDDLSEWATGVAEIRRSLTDDPNLVEWFEGLAREATPKVRQRDQFRPNTLGYNYGHLHLDAARFGVKDTVGAAKLITSILNYDRDDLYIDVAPPLLPPPWFHQLITRVAALVFKSRTHS